MRLPSFPKAKAQGKGQAETEAANVDPFLQLPASAPPAPSSEGSPAPPSSLETNASSPTRRARESPFKREEKSAEAEVDDELVVDGSRRSLTDAGCLACFFALFLIFLTMAWAGYSGGAPRKLLAPRDYRGMFCGLDSDAQWHSDQDLQDFGNLIFTVNMSSFVDSAVQELVCSDASEEALTGLLSSGDLEEYRCSCCKKPCDRCQGILSGVSDGLTAEAVATAVSKTMTNLWSTSRVWEVLSVDQKYLRSCSRSCDVAANSSALRHFSYTPPADSYWALAWRELQADERDAYSPLRRTIVEKFQFDALSSDDCPYDAQHCVPFPGVTFSEASGGFCKLDWPAQFAASSLRAAFAHFRAEATASIGSALGDLLGSLDVLAVVAVAAICLGFVAIVLIRFFVKPVLWTFLLGVPFLLGATGSFALVISDRCLGESLAASGIGYLAKLETSFEVWLLGGNSTTDEAEALSGTGADYRGHQARTRSGRSCQAWDEQYPHPHSETSSAYPESGLNESYCRNPSGSAAWIFCYTLDEDVRWEYCDPLTSTVTTSATCPTGYAVEQAGNRKALKIAAVILIVLACLWLVVVLCLRSRVQLALSVYEEATRFILQVPLALLVPALQSVVALLWLLFWSFSASALLAQVPGSIVDNTARAKADAFDGRCEDGFVWHDSTASECNLDDNVGPRCWRCAPPRYSLDARFAVALFVFYWTNETIIAVGICVLAGTCGLWWQHSATQRRNPVEGRSALIASVRNTFLCHLGSLAFGAAFVAFVRVVRSILAWVQAETSKTKNRVVMAILMCLQCCLWLFETALKYVSSKAYIQVALKGTPFCTSAKAAFFLIASHPITLATLGVLRRPLRWIGVAFISALSALFGFLLLRWMEPSAAPLLPLLVFSVLGYIIGSAFMNLFHIVSDTILQCVLLQGKWAREPSAPPPPTP